MMFTHYEISGWAIEHKDSIRNKPHYRIRKDFGPILERISLLYLWEPTFVPMVLPTIGPVNSHFREFKKSLCETEHGLGSEEGPYLRLIDLCITQL